ncbi:MAG TPA: hypothetical protein VK869_10525 [Rubrobacteraceae bacterium]|nr:hypothetical protein [Rubrobacteraceae bacterium]
MAEVNVSVSVADSSMDRFSGVVRRLKDSGLNVDQELEDIGVVTGSVDSEKVEGLGEVEGVARVERSRDLRIAPPDSDIQ